MKILHTSDWHLGHRLYDQLQLEEQQAFLTWLIATINVHSIDLLLVAGDVFDTSAPSTHSQKMYYDFLIALRATSCTEVVIIGGNHDGPGVIDAPKAILHALSIHVVGRAQENIEDEIIALDIKGERLHIAAVPYLRDQDIRRAVAGESFDQIEERYKKAIVQHFTMAADLLPKDSTSFNMAMGHLFATNTQVSDSEQSIYVGNLGHIGAADFSSKFDYIALGHLHRPQLVGGMSHIRYSGSPLPYSFGEAKQTKSVEILRIEQGQLTEVTRQDIPLLRPLYQISGTQEDIMAQLRHVHEQNHDMLPWVEIVIEQHKAIDYALDEINDLAETLNLKLIKVSFKNSVSTRGIEQLIDASKQLKELSPMDVFRLKCKEQEFDLEENTAIEDAFVEILHHIQEQ